MFGMSREQVESIKNRYPNGTKVVMNYCADPYNPIESGITGIVDCVDDVGTIHINWDNGRRFGVVLGEDSISKIEGEK